MSVGTHRHALSVGMARACVYDVARVYAQRVDDRACFGGPHRVRIRTVTPGPRAPPGMVNPLAAHDPFSAVKIGKQYGAAVEGTEGIGAE